eukprot:TRINITY_DN5895_c1_g1_i1.p1 TRINITY_DN5895_c1_g1~~TRINITY_DN5895_c1_g1_i1.p1  ORF type:complete len:195 (+),score=-22.55 TRINITY_DN5895_c1_g1_i1:88-672(+)
MLQFLIILVFFNQTFIFTIGNKVLHLKDQFLCIYENEQQVKFRFHLNRASVYIDYISFLFQKCGTAFIKIRGKFKYLNILDTNIKILLLTILKILTIVNYPFFYPVFKINVLFYLLIFQEYVLEVPILVTITFLPCFSYFQTFSFFSDFHNTTFLCCFELDFIFSYLQQIILNLTKILSKSQMQYENLSQYFFR